MKKLLLILLCLPMIGFGQTWEIEYLSNGYDLNTVYFYNDTIGYAVGDNGAMIKTIDAGDNWIDLNSNTTKDINDIIFVNEDTGYYCTEGAVNPVIIEGEIFATYDGGISWTSIFISPSVNYSFWFTKFHKLESSSLYVLGSNYYSSGNPFNEMIMILDLTNFSYSSLPHGSGSRIAYDSYNYSSTSYTRLAGAAIGGGGTFSSNPIKTNVSGTNISPNYPSSGSLSVGNLYSIDMLDSNPVNGVAVGRNGKIINLFNTISTNNIITINSSFSNGAIDLWSVDMMNDKGWIVGDLGTILFTVDSGQTWSPYNNPILFEDLHSVVFTDPCKGYFVGENGVVGRYRYEEYVSVSLCENSQNLSLFSLLDSNAINLGGVWTDSAGNPISYLINPNTLSIGNHSFYYSFYICNEVKESVVNVTINEMPILATTVLNNVACNGNNTGKAQVNMLNGGVIYTNCVWSSGSTNSIAPNLLAGAYTVNVTDTNGCSSNSSVIITEPSILTNTTSTVNVICNGGFDGSITTTANGGVSPYQYSLGGLSSANGIFINLFAGMYNLDITDSNGCSIVDTIFINEPNTTSFQPSFTVCEGDNVIVGNSVYNTTGVYIDTLSTTNGCDSIVYASVNVIPTTVLQLVTTICNGDSVIVGNSIYNTVGNYTDTLTSSNGCDSIVNLNLTINNSTTSTDTQVACDTYTWNGDTYTTSGTYTNVSTNAAGCDHTETLELTINNSTSNTTTDVACDTYTWEGVTYTTSGFYTNIYTNLSGCDSSVTLDLTINSVIASISQSGQILTAVTTPIGLNANWYNIQKENGSTRIWIMEVDESSFIPTFDCSYFIVVSDNGCTDTSEIYAYGENAARIGSFITSPNPTTGLINVKFDNPKSQFVMLELINNNGSKLDEFITIDNNLDIDLSKYPSGSYYLYFNSEDAVQGCRLEEVQKLSTKIILNK